jgi:release factor glutamine methyltransferase
MGIKIQTIKDIRLLINRELTGLYPENEISALTSLIIKTIFPGSGLHQIYDPGNPVSEEKQSQVTLIVNELKHNRPVQYIIGHTYFYGCKINVTPATLIPRQETEELVDLIIKENRRFTGNITEIGTGSGCIAIALAVNLPATKVTATDISDEALIVAGQNAVSNNVNIRFIKDDILNPAKRDSLKSGIIVSNPPYVRNSEKAHIHRNILDYEPHTALFVDDSDPLVFYKAIIYFAQTSLEPGGKIYFEINEAMGMEMNNLLNASGYCNVQIVKDLNGKDRIAKGIKK